MTRKRARVHAARRAFDAALDAAAEEAALNVPAKERRYPDPHCLNRPDLFVDYVIPPSAEEAEELCDGCPLFALCRASARRAKPAWGVWGGVAYVDGRSAHLPEAEAA